MKTENQTMSYIEDQIKESIDRLKKIQSIKSEIFPDRVLASKERLRFYYLNEVELDKIKIDQRIVVREKDQALLDKLKPQIESEGLIEPLTVMDMGNNQFLLIAGQHRYHVLKELGLNKAPAKIYLDLTLDEQLTLGYMSNEARKDPPAGRKYGALHEIYNEIKNKMKKDLEREPSEAEVINEMYMTKIPRVAKFKIREIIIGMITDRLIHDSTGLVSKYKFISVRQVPKSKILNLINQYHQNKTPLEFPLLTSQNAFYGLFHLVRPSATTHDEDKTGKNFRHLEFQNVLTFFDLLITKHIQSWMESSEPEIDAAMNVCKRHIFETLCKLIAHRLRDKGFDILTKDGLKAPLYTNEKIPWNAIFDDLAPFFTPTFLNHPNIAKERSLDMLWNRAEYYVLVKPGKMPPF